VSIQIVSIGMSSAIIDEETVVQNRDEQTQPLSRTFDVAISLFLVLAGAVFGAAGYLLAGFADVGRVTSWVASGRITSTEMSDPELIDAVYAFIWGSGVSLTLTGVMLVVAGIAFFGFQTRARRRFDATGIVSPSTTGNAILGAMVTSSPRSCRSPPSSVAGSLDTSTADRIAVPFEPAAWPACSPPSRSSPCSLSSSGVSSGVPRG